MIEVTGIKEIILYVEDMEKMVGFYRDIIGLRVQYPRNVRRYDKEHWVAFWAGACILGLHSGGKRHLGEGAPRIVFGINDIDHARNYLLQREIPISEVRIPSPGVMICDGIDPEGNTFSLEYTSTIFDVPSQPLID
jgi:predicted enzyme related to lactoylglutathione lyase